MTIENTIANAETMLADFLQLRTEIEARNPVVGTYVLRWFYEGSSLYVGKDGTGSIGATGFSKAHFFGDREAAVSFLRRSNIRNGHGHPEPVLAFNAKQGALLDMDGVIKTMQTIVDNKRDADLYAAEKEG